MGKFIDLTGKKFNKLTVLGIAEKRGKNYFWKCQCDCGNIAIVSGSSLRYGGTKSCGCLKQESDKSSANKFKIDLTGQKFGKLIVIKSAGRTKGGECLWECQCDCGNIKNVSSSYLRSGHTASCGCIKASHGEIKISKLLCEHHINFEPFVKLFKFPNSIGWAEFDFYIDNKYLIEFDGQQHFLLPDTVYNWRTKDEILKTQARDKIKSKWCKENNIPLIRIPYTAYASLKIDDLILTQNNKYIDIDTNTYYTLRDLENTTTLDINFIYKISRFKSVKQYDLEGNYIKQYNTFEDIQNDFPGLKTMNKIYACCKKKIKSSIGYQWRYLDDTTEVLNILPKSKKIILQIDPVTNEILNEFNGYQGVISAGFSQSAVSKSILYSERLGNGYYWKVKVN